MRQPVAGLAGLAVVLPVFVLIAFAADGPERRCAWAARSSRSGCPSSR
ncbi:hypothetical protein [Actinoplanes solisilvae]|nr:hypothetical protein [Actinoplanes solisilvae]